MTLPLFYFPQSPMFDGKVPHWHHFSCFWLRASAQSPADIAGFSDLRWEDQEKVKKAIETGGAAGGQSLTFSFSPSVESSVYPFDVIEMVPQKMSCSLTGGQISNNTLASLSGKGDVKGGAKGEKTLNDFAVEYAKSNRSTCKGCEQKIEKVRSHYLDLFIFYIEMI